MCARFLGARKDEGEGGGGSGSGVTRGKYEGGKKKKRGRYSDATESLENELSLSTGTPRPALRCRGEHSDSSARVMTGKKNDLLTSLPPLTPSTVAAQTQRARGESTSILPVPGGAPLKDKTTTIRLRFPASCCPFGWGYVHREKKKKKNLQRPCLICVHALSVHQGA